jgi:hypothetical protein
MGGVALGVRWCPTRRRSAATRPRSGCSPSGSELVRGAALDRDSDLLGTAVLARCAGDAPWRPTRRAPWHGLLVGGLLGLPTFASRL